MSAVVAACLGMFLLLLPVVGDRTDRSPAGDRPAQARRSSTAFRPRAGLPGAAVPIETRSAAFVLELVAGGLEAGAPPSAAIGAVTSAAEAVGSPTLQHAVAPLRRVGRLLELGADPEQAWTELEGVSAYHDAARAARRCARSGARLATALRSSAADLRTERHGRALARAERVGIWSLLPLGACFLPAFVCLGVAPVIVGVASSVLGGGLG